MTLFYISLLILCGLLFLVVELLLLPGISIGALLAIISFGGAIYLAFNALGAGWGAAVIVAIILLSLLAVIICLRTKTWQRFSLKNEIKSSSMPVTPGQVLKVGERGTTLSRLSPMGKIEVNGETYEAKTTGIYIDQRQEIEIIGFENFSVIVKKI